MHKIRAFIEKRREIISYVFWGGMTTLVGLGTFWLFIRLGLNPLLANTLSTVIAVLFAFVVNKFFVFGAKKNDWKTVLRELLIFCGGRLFSFGAETALLALLIYVLHTSEMAAKAVTSVVVIVLNYIVSKWLVFRKE